MRRRGEYLYLGPDDVIHEGDEFTFRTSWSGCNPGRVYKPGLWAYDIGRTVSQMRGKLTDRTRTGMAIIRYRRKINLGEHALARIHL